MKGRGIMMFHFRGSDCKRSGGSTWYDRMDSLMMAIGFTKSKVDSNLYSKVEGGILGMFLLYVDDLFLKENRNSLKLLTRRGSLLPSLK